MCAYIFSLDNNTKLLTSHKTQNRPSIQLHKPRYYSTNVE